MAEIVVKLYKYPVGQAATVRYKRLVLCRPRVPVMVGAVEAAEVKMCERPRGHTGLHLWRGQRFSSDA